MEEIEINEVFTLDGGNTVSKDRSHIGGEWIDFYFVSNGQKIILKCEAHASAHVLDMDGYIGHSVYVDNESVKVTIYTSSEHDAGNITYTLTLPEYFNGVKMKEYTIEYLYKKVSSVMKEFTDTIYGFNV